MHKDSSFVRFVIAHPRLLVLLVVLVTVALGVGLRRGLVLDVSPQSFIEHASQARLDFERTRRQFGDDRVMIIAVVCDDVFTPANFAKLRSLHEKISALSGVAEVLSLSNAPFAHSLAEGAALEKLVPAGPLDAARLREARELATRDRLFAGNLVSPDAKTAALNVLFKPTLASEEQYQFTEIIYDLTQQAGFAANYFAGDPYSQWRSISTIKRDLKLFLPLTLILIALLLWLSFRSLAAVLLPLLTIGIGLIWLLGLMAWLKAHFTILALMLPTLMLAIGCSYLIHVLNQIGIEAALTPDHPPEQWIAQALRFITLPVVVSALTILAGFLSLAFTKIPAIRTTAVYAAIGALITMLLSLTFVPAVLLLLKQQAKPLRIGLAGGLVRRLEATGKWATDHQNFLYVLTALIAVVSAIGVGRIQVEIDYFHFFKANSETTLSLEEVNRRLAGVVTIDLVIEGQQPGAIEDARVLQRIAELQAFAERQTWHGQGIDHSLSIVDFIKHSNRAFNHNDERFYSLPTDNRVIEELLSERDQLKSFLTRDGRSARILIRSNLSRSSLMAQVLPELEKKGRELLPEFRVYATGTFVLLNRTSDQIAGEQVLSISLALVTIYLMLSALFRSLRVGFTALVPNLIPVLFFFGFMGWRGIPLNLTTSLVASVVLGLAVDNAVQFIVRFRRVQREDSDLQQAIIESMRLSGRPIIYANIALAVTFAIFALSDFEPVASFGLLSAITILGCLIEDLVLLPSRLTSPIFRAK
ncbi:MAG: MMPL family transporter [Acidobacteria bacterium]|nr:MMPL family transporter [Acidobacteriota bacterium]MBI3422570.1 MMPL family transporter [Acidobacteriota bacterium]